MNKPKERDIYYAKHGKEIDAFKQSRDYINAVLNDKVTTPLVKEWKSDKRRK